MKTSKIIIIAFLLLSAVAAMAQEIDSDKDGTPDMTDYYPLDELTEKKFKLVNESAEQLIRSI